MNVNVTQKTLRDLPIPVPFQGSGKRRHPRPTPGYQPAVTLLTGPQPTDETSRLKSLVTVGIPQPDPEPRSKRINWIVGTVLGSLAMLCVLNLWVAVTIGVLNDALGIVIPYWIPNSFPLAIYGAHLFGLPGAGLSRGGFQLGLVAIVSFWGSLLIAVPIAAILRLVGV
jgi:hypothetical protein